MLQNSDGDILWEVKAESDLVNIRAHTLIIQRALEQVKSACLRLRAGVGRADLSSTTKQSDNYMKEEFCSVHLSDFMTLLTAFLTYHPFSQCIFARGESSIQHLP